MKLWREFWQEEDAVGVVEIILILVGILTPYYGAVSYTHLDVYKRQV